MSTPAPTISHDLDSTPGTDPSRPPWRLGLDLGAGSIGWAVLDLRPRKGDPQTGEVKSWEPYRLRDLGVWIFESGQDERGQSANIKRREFRSARRRLVGVKCRKVRLLRRLIELGCIERNEGHRRRSRDEMVEIPGGLYAIPSSWALRWTALRRPGHLARTQLGIVLMSLVSARGQAFSTDSDSERLLPKTTRLQGQIVDAGAVAFGDYAAQLRARDRDATLRARNGVDHFLSRAMVISEFDAIRNAQTALLPDEEWAELKEIIFDRPVLRPPAPGRCPFVPDEERIPMAHPIYQDFKILQSIRNIRLRSKAGEVKGRDSRLSEKEVAAARAFLRDKRHVSPAALFRAIGLKGFSSNFHADEGDIPGNETSALLSHADAFGAAWLDKDERQQEAIVERALEVRASGAAPDYADLAALWHLPDEQHARAVVERLPRGRRKYGITATRRLLALMEDGLSLHDARERAFPEKIQARDLDRLPYYGRILTEDVFDADPDADTEEQRLGRVRNPVVHVALNQVRGLVNALVEEFGKPAEVVVELVRGIRLNEKEKHEVLRKSGEKKRRRDSAATCIRDSGYPVSAERIDRYQLWEELGVGERLCPYSLKPITGITQLMEECEVDHIVPRSRCGDDSLANKTVVFRDQNRLKGERTPFEAFGAETRYSDILVNAKKNWSGRNARKYRRYTADAANEFCDKFANRELNDTAYAAGVTRRYLAALGVPVHAARGSITGRLRKAWKLADLLPLPEGLRRLREEAKAAGKTIPDEVKRHDHRHHAIDAAIVGLIDPSCLADYFRKSEEQTHKDLPPPWKTFGEELRALLDRRDRVVRHRRRHKKGFAYTGELLKAARYRPVERKDGTHIRIRKQLRDIAIGRDGALIAGAKPDDAGWLAGQWADVADLELRSLLDEVFTPASFSLAREEATTELLEALPEDHGPNAERRRQAEAMAWSRLCQRFTERNCGRAAVTIERPWGNPILVKDLKLPSRRHAFESGGNAYAIIVRTSGRRGPRYESRVVTLVDAARGAPAPEPRGTIARLHAGDMLALRQDGRQFHVVVRALKENGKICLALHNNANAGKVATKKGAYQMLPAVESYKSVNVIFGTLRARVVRPSALGKID
ncbi:MAG: type II CRISPR RNA-guided endonuclease Cas9 [Candidatus Tyrphobacter sp.]